MASKIVKASGAQPDEFELSVAQELLNLEVCRIQHSDCLLHVFNDLL